MITPTFREDVEKGLGAVVILAGSGSDDKHIEKIAIGLRNYEIPFEVRVCSAHKQAENLHEIIREYDSLNGPLVYIAVAGGTDALSGTISFMSNRPTISCPPDALNMSCLTNPPGSSNAYVARADNAARFVAQLFSYINQRCAQILDEKRHKKIESLEKDDGVLRTKYAVNGVLA